MSFPSRSDTRPRGRLHKILFVRRSAILLLVVVLGACTRTPYPTPAPNLTSPAPKATVGFPLATTNGQCVLLPIRTQRVRPSELIDVLGQQVPTRLPAGFGFLAGWASAGRGGSNGAVWLDARCRQVTLEVWPNAAARESPMPDGRWLLLEHYTCKAEMVCLDYRAHSDSGVIDLSFVGVSRRDASRIVAGVHV